MNGLGRRVRRKNRALPAFVITLLVVLAICAVALAWWDSNRSFSRTAKNTVHGQAAGVERVLTNKGFSCFETVRPEAVRTCYRTYEGPVVVGVSLTSSETGEVRTVAVKSEATGGGDTAEPFLDTVKALDGEVLSDQLAVMTRPKGRVTIGWGSGELEDHQFFLQRKGSRPIALGKPKLPKAPKAVLAGFGKGGMRCQGASCRGSLWGSTIVEVRDLGNSLQATATVEGEPDAVDTALRKFLGDVVRQLVVGDDLDAVDRWLDANVDPSNRTALADFAGYHLVINRTVKGKKTEVVLTVAPAVPVVTPGS